MGAIKDFLNGLANTKFPTNNIKKITAKDLRDYQDAVATELEKVTDAAANALIGISGIAQPNDTIPATGFFQKIADTAQTYTNYKDSGNAAIVVTSADLDVVSGVANNRVILRVNNGVAKKIVERVKGDTGPSGKTTETWSAKAFPIGSTVYHLNTVWTNPTTAAVSGNIPGTSAVWVSAIDYKPVFESNRNSIFSLDATKLNSSLKTAIKSLEARWKITDRKLDGTIKKVWISKFGSATDLKTYFSIQHEMEDGTLSASYAVLNTLTSSLPDPANVVVEMHSKDLYFRAVVDFTAAPYFSILGYQDAAINSVLIKPTTARENISLSLTNKNYFEKIGGKVVSGNFGEKNNALSIPLMFTGKTAISITAKFDNLHVEEGIAHLLFTLTGGQSVPNIVKLLDFNFTRKRRITNPNGNNSQDFGDSIPNSAVKCETIIYHPQTQSFNNPQFFKRDSIPFTIGNGFSIRFKGDLSITTNQTIACELLTDRFRIFNTVGNVTIYEVLFSSLSGTVKSLYTNLKTNLSSDFELKMYADGNISSLTQFSHAKLASLKNNGTANFYTAFPVYIPYANEDEITYTIVLDADKDKYRVFAGDSMQEFSVLNSFSPRLKSLSGGEILLVINPALAAYGVNITKIEVKNDISEYVGIRRIFAIGHAVVESEEYLPAVPLTSSTAYLERMFQELKKQGFVNVSAQEYEAYLEGRIKLPNKTFSVCYDDNRWEIYTNKQIRDLHLRYDQKPMNGTILTKTGSWTPPTTQITHAMERMGWNNVVHAYNHTPLTRMTYDELLFEIHKAKEGMDEVELNSKIWILMGGNTDREITKTLLMEGFICAPTSSDVVNTNNVSRNGYPVFGRMHVEDYVTWQNFLDSIKPV